MNFPRLVLLTAGWLIVAVIPCLRLDPVTAVQTDGHLNAERLMIPKSYTAVNSTAVINRARRGGAVPEAKKFTVPEEWLEETPCDDYYNWSLLEDQAHRCTHVI